jgi:hypothetical protein
MPAQHEHELESQHPMTPGLLRRESAGTSGRVVSRPRKLVSAEMGHLEPPGLPVSRFSGGVLSG